MDDDWITRLTIVNRTATALFASTSLVAAITVGALLVGDWGAGILDNRVEWVFWAGAILGAVGIALLGLATLPPGRDLSRTVRRSSALVRAGLALFLVAPVLCVVAVFTDYWI
ncbi:hypothetical protein BH09ACT5_BH09ACT5_10270 [soil metagenome]